MISLRTIVKIERVNTFELMSGSSWRQMSTHKVIYKLLTSLGSFELDWFSSENAIDELDALKEFKIWELKTDEIHRTNKT